MKTLVGIGILLCAEMLSGIVLAQEREDELATRQVCATDVDSFPLDCSSVFEVRRERDDPALKGLTYSSIGWELDAEESQSRTVAIVARGGAFDAGGVFVSDGSEAIEVMDARSGRGTFDWTLAEISKRLFRLEHVVRLDDGSVDASGTLYGYLDFTHCNGHASQADVEFALLSPVSCPVTVQQDAENPWQPIGFSLPGLGVETDSSVQQGVKTQTTIAFNGHGALFYEHRLTGGVLQVKVNGKSVATFEEVTAAWTLHSLTFDDGGEHTVVFEYTVGGDGAAAAVRGVRWDTSEKFSSAGSSLLNVRTDLRNGVRTEKYLSDVLPFAYSSTNWLGDVVGVSASSVTRVAVVQMAGDDPVVTNWTAEVQGTLQELVRRPGEGTVRWKPASPGVWKATFEILGTDHNEEAWFDLRESRARGFMLMVF